MHAPASGPHGGAVPKQSEPPARPVRGPPGKAEDWAQVLLRLAHDHDRIARDIDDVVVNRLFTAGLALETALGLIGSHPAAGKVQEAIGEVDLAIRDCRTVLFDHHQRRQPG
jgi:signal transduction histidine kinase